MAKLKVTERKLGREGALGQIWIDENHIEIDPRLKGETKFKIMLHEFLHKAFPEMEEKDILHGERIVGNGMWKHWVKELLKK